MKVKLLSWPWKRGGWASHIETGLWGERQAAAELRRAGFKILGQRVRVGRRDELDFVARDGDTLVFVEVKTRRDESFGRPVSGVNASKRYTLSRAAVRYMKRLRPPPSFFRFDVVEVIGSEEGKSPEIRHLRNVFPLDRKYRVRW